MKLAKDLLAAFRSVNRLTDALAQKHDCSPDEYFFLMLLQGGKHPLPGMIAKELAITASRTSRYLGRLESKGLIHREIGKEDHRQMHFTITEKGRAFLAEVQGAVDSIR